MRTSRAGQPRIELREQRRAVRNFHVVTSLGPIKTTEQFRRRLLEVDRFRSVRELLHARPKRGRKYARIAQQPRLGFMNREVLPEARVPNLTLQFSFGPGVLGIGGPVLRELQRCAVQVQQADNSDQPTRIEVSLAR